MVTKFYQHIMALVFAINEINANSKILPNITVGFHIYDSYHDMRMTYRTTMDLLYKLHRYFPNYECDTSKNIAAIIGGYSSAMSFYISEILRVYKIPQLTYGSFAPEKITHLSSSFYRVVPSEVEQYIGILRLLQHFQWTWVGLLAVDDDSGEHFVQVMEPLLFQSEICLAFVQRILTKDHWNDMDDVTDFILSARLAFRDSSANIFILYGESTVLIFLNTLLSLGDPSYKEKTSLRKVWIMTAQVDFALTGLHRAWDFQFFHGTISFTIHSNEIHGFQNFLQDRKPHQKQGNGFLKDFWEQAFDCYYPNPQETRNISELCTGDERLESLPGPLFEMHMSGHSYSIYNAVYAIGHAVHSLYSSRSNHRAMDGGQRVRPQDFHPWQGVPISVCNDYCYPGYQKKKKEGATFCCYNCAPCPEGKISNQKDMDDCIKCPQSQYPSKDQDGCILKSITFLSFEETLGFSLASFAVSFSLFTAVVLIIFIKHRDTPIVKANNRNITYILLIALLLCFLSSLLFLGRPRKETCLFRQSAFALIFSGAVSCVLAKTVTVIVAFMATQPGSCTRRWAGKTLTNSIVISCSLVQAAICLLWLGASPPFPDFDSQSLKEEIVAECNEGSVPFFYVVLSYLGLLSLISLIVAFFARKLPDTFNEAKFITFSMLIFCSVWLSFIPAYLSTKGKSTVAMEIFCILVSSTGLLGCIFVPKCYIIVLRPELNRRGVQSQFTWCDGTLQETKSASVAKDEHLPPDPSATQRCSWTYHGICKGLSPARPFGNHCTLATGKQLIVMQVIQ
ncbi:PREDICTED: vomeronasal type-2 receptor 116-like [Gekko japonicus]|uniref:Vomeronasal type-2 receptor 116-like n=1 Tax=Gekko japonicus TaxID=146911 RepID=A0ABM1K963_GEKJA|nr:PREDICTED: vomeronasal type-2 receptor 116-like [Gekko japonicus]